MADSQQVPTTPQPAIDIAALMRRLDEEQARARKLVEPNKRALFAVLAPAGITRVTVTFDGGGDSGQIEAMDAFCGDDSASLPEGEVMLERHSYRSDEVEQIVLSVPEAIEDLCYALLGQEHGGWENNEGGYGEFVFDVAGGSIALDMNIRIETSEFHGHQW